jgi:hypothetical protein
MEGLNGLFRGLLRCKTGPFVPFFRLRRLRLPQVSLSLGKPIFCSIGISAIPLFLRLYLGPVQHRL